MSDFDISFVSYCLVFFWIEKALCVQQLLLCLAINVAFFIIYN